MEIKPIPAFYCCYLLRSTIRKASHYVGSTPHPSRRLGQHNGKVKGGAVRTSRASLRPWEMTCIVAGFPSNIAALQFEWAWHNAHLTRHIPPHERLSIATTRTKTSAKTGKTRRKPGRPRTSLMDKLSNLHLLLRVPYFSRWPLEVRFFSEEVYRSWQSWCERVDEQLRPGISVILDLQQVEAQEEITSAQRPAKRRKIDLIGKGGVEGVDPTYARFQDVLEKSRFLLDEGDDQKCNVCSKVLDFTKDLVVICPRGQCRGLSHISCLSKHFLKQNQSTLLVPEDGRCPSCQNHLEWAELMRDVALRARGEKEVRKLLGKRRKTKAATAAEILETESEDDDDSEGELTAADVVDEDEAGSDDDDVMSTTSIDTLASVRSRKEARVKSTLKQSPLEPKRLEIVIEDSDDEG